MFLVNYHQHSVRMLPNRGDRHVVTAEIHSSSQRSALGMSVKRPAIYCEVIARPAVCSRRQSTSVSKHTVDSNDARRCYRARKTPALQSLSDSNILAKTRRPTLRTDRLKTECVSNDAKPHNDACVVSRSRTVSGNNYDTLQSSVSLLHDNAAYHWRKCQKSVTEDRDKADSRENRFVAIRERHNISESLTHASASAVGRVYVHNGCQGDLWQSSAQTSLCGRLVKNGSNSSRNKCQAKSADSGFLGRVHSAEDEEFLQNLKKAYSRLRKARSGGRSSRVRQRKTATSGSKAFTGELCVVGRTFVTGRETTVSTANNLQAKNVLIGQVNGRDLCSEVDGILLRSRPLSVYTHRLQGIVNDVSGNSDHNAAAGALLVTNSDKKNARVPSVKFQSCSVGLIPEDWSTGKISVQLSFHNYISREA